VTVAIIAALAKNRVIGRNGILPWHIGEDLKRFKRLTVGSTVLMGRTTWQSLGKPLPERRNVVLSSRVIPDTECYRSVQEAFEALKTEQRVFVIGGGNVFAQVLDRTDELYLTIVDRDVEGDTYFPRYEHLIGTVFREVHREPRPGFTFIDYVRIPS
jgi:dihydrofolate reductase